MSPSRTWFVTGCSRGLGLAIAHAVAASGDRVVATARDAAELAGLASTFGERVLPLAMDVTDPDAVAAAVRAAHLRFGRIDVVVNNAGFAEAGPVETMPEESFRRQFETNFWGVYHVSRGILPVLKAQGSGLVVQISSIGGRIGGDPGLGAYQAAKFAVDGLTRVLAAETAPFGIRYLVIEPGALATEWGRSAIHALDIPEDYEATIGAFAARVGRPAQGDPRRVAATLVRLARTEALPSHLPLGSRAADRAIEDARSRLAEARAWREVAASVDTGSPFPVPLPGDA